MDGCSVQSLEDERVMGNASVHAPSLSLYPSCFPCCIDIISTSLSLALDYGAPQAGWTALILASYDNGFDNLEVVKAHVAAGADVNAKNNVGVGGLGWAGGGIEI